MSKESWRGGVGELFQWCYVKLCYDKCWRVELENYYVKSVDMLEEYYVKGRLLLLECFCIRVYECIRERDARTAYHVHSFIRLKGEVSKESWRGGVGELFQWCYVKLCYDKCWRVELENYYVKSVDMLEEYYVKGRLLLLECFCIRVYECIRERDAKNMRLR